MPIQGLQFTIANGTEQHQSYQATGSFIVYNPNDGVCLVATDRTATLLSWDYKIPSQSGGRFPGPINSYLSIFFLDQSGANQSGQVIIYASRDSVEIPYFWSIGRSIQSQVTSLDIQQGVQPGNPPAGVTRVWSDVSGNVYHLINTGVNCEFLDTCNYTPLITNLTGPLSVVNKVVAARLVAGIDPGAGGTGDVVANRGGASPGSGAYYFGNSAGLHYIFYDGTNINITDRVLVTGAVRATGDVAAGPPISGVAGDINANRNNGTGYCYLADGSHYIGFDGTNYQLPSSNTNVLTLTVNGGTNSPSALIALQSRLGAQILLFDNGAGAYFGFGINSGELAVVRPSGSLVRIREGNTSGTGWPMMASQANASDWKFDAGRTFVTAAGLGTPIAISFTTAFTTTPTSITCTMSDITGGRSTYHNIGLGMDGLTASGFNIVVDNNSGGSQSVFINWMAFGH